MEMTAIVMPAPEGGFVALNPETGSTSQGETVEEAVANLREATRLYIEEFPLVQAGRPLLTTFEIPANAQIAGCFRRRCCAHFATAWL